MVTVMTALRVIIIFSLVLCLESLSLPESVSRHGVERRSVGRELKEEKEEEDDDGK